MYRFRRLNDLKKKLKKSRRHVWILGAGAAFFMLAALTGSIVADRLIGLTRIQAPWPEDSVSVWSDRTGEAENAVRQNAAACPAPGYIGMDKEGTLSLFDGPPQLDKVIKSFFQINIERLETSLSPEEVQELANGIRICDQDEYNSVVSTYSEYANSRSSAED